MADTYRWMRCDELAAVMEQRQQVIIVDCRSQIEYDTSHIINSVSVGGTRTARRDIIQKRVAVPAALVAALGRPIADTNTLIVSYDQCSNGVSSLAGQALLAAVYDGLTIMTGSCFLLEGGFIGFQSQFPAHCWVSKHKLPDEDFVAPSQSLLELASPVTSGDVLPVPGSGLTRSHTMAALHSQQVLRASPFSRHGGNRLAMQLGVHRHSLSGPAVPPLEQGPTAVLGHLLLGSQQDAMSRQCIQQFRITHVINVSIDGPECPFVPARNFLRIPVMDNFADRITQHFPQAFEFLDNVKLLNGRALIHCSAGISRSPTLAIGYLMKTQTMTVVEAYNFIKASRSSVSPNFNFMGQLTDYEQELRLAREQAKSNSKQARPKRRPSRLGFLSSLWRQSGSSQKLPPSTLSIADSSLSSVLTTSKFSTASLLPSPSVPFAKLGISSPMDDSPTSSTSFRIENFPATSLEQLHFQPCQVGPRGAVKGKRSATHISDDDSSKIRKCLSVSDESSSARTLTLPLAEPCQSQDCPFTVASGKLPRRNSSNFPGSAFGHALTAIDAPCCEATTASGCLSSGEGLSELTFGRSVSFERLPITESNWGGSAAATVLSDSCRLQECHQSTSSLSSANSHSSNVLV